MPIFKLVNSKIEIPDGLEVWLNNKQIEPIKTTEPTQFKDIVADEAQKVEKENVN